MRIIPLIEGNYYVDKDKRFIQLQDNDITKGIKLAVQSFLIITSTDHILLDTGLGTFTEDGLLLYKCLKKENIRPEQITKILISHLHKDHINGIGYFKDNIFYQSFPNAKIYIQQRELDFALSLIDNPSYNLKILNILSSLPNVIFLKQDSGKLNEVIKYEVTGGHTPFHQVFYLSESGQTIFYGADDLPQRSFLKYHVAYKGDFNGVIAREKRQEWEIKAKSNKWILLFCHDMKTPVITL